MSNVIGIGSAAAEDESLSLRRIRLGSRALEILFATLLAVGGTIAAALVLAALAYPGDRLQICAHNAWLGLGGATPPPGCRTLSTLPPVQRLAYALVAGVRAIPMLMIFSNLRSLFGLYAAGSIFARDNAARLKGAGGWLAAAALAPLAGHLFLSAAGMEIDKAWLHLASVQELVLGALVFVIAQVMQVGHELEEEQRRFV